MVYDEAMTRLKLRLLLALIVVTVGAGACSSGDESDQSGSGGQGTSGPEYLLCTEPADSWTDLTGEDEGWRTGTPLVGWTDESGCAIRLDTVWHQFGQEECEWEDTERLSIGLPIGTPYTGPDATPPGQDWDPFFFFNTNGDFEDLPQGEVIAAADVPETAVDTGLRTATGRRMSIADDEQTLYEIQGATARVFVRSSDDATSCA